MAQTRVAAVNLNFMGGFLGTITGIYVSLRKQVKAWLCDDETQRAAA
jgi:hypothetical protein